MVEMLPMVQVVPEMNLALDPATGLLGASLGSGVVILSMDDVDAAVLPEAGGGGGGDGDAALLFLLHPVHGGFAVVGLADLVRHAGVEKDTLGGGGLAGVDMGHDADIALFVYGYGAGHGLPP